MPNYKANPTTISLAAGQTFNSFNAESPAAPQAGERFSPVRLAGTRESPILGVDITYSAAPATVQIDIQGADIDADASYVTVYSSTNVNGEHVNLVNQKFNFFRAKKVLQTGVANVTVAFVR